MTRWVLPLTFVLATTSAYAQNELDSNARGIVKVEGNELLVDSTIEDAAAVRVGAPRSTHSGGGGKFSFDVLLPNGTRREIALTAAGEGANGPEWGLILLKRGGSTVDADQIRVVEATAEGIEFRVPVRFSGGANVAGGSTSAVYSANRRFALAVLDDGTLVHYEDVGSTWCPRWAIPQGAIPREGWPMGHECR